MLLDKEDVKEAAASYLRIGVDRLNIRTKFLRKVYTVLDFSYTEVVSSEYVHSACNFSIPRNENKLYYLIDYALVLGSSAKAKACKLKLNDNTVYSLMESRINRPEYYDETQTEFFKSSLKTSFRNVFFDASDFRFHTRHPINSSARPFVSLELVYYEISII